MKSEKDLQSYLRSECFKHDILYYKFASPSVRGVPDVIIVNPRHELCKVQFIELKSPSGKGKLHPLQLYEIKKLRDADVPVHIIDDKAGVDQLIENLTL